MKALAYIAASCIFAFGMQLAIRQIVSTLDGFRKQLWNEEIPEFKRELYHTVLGTTLVAVAATAMYALILITIYNQL